VRLAKGYIVTATSGTMALLASKRLYKYITISIVGVENISELMQRDDTNHDWWQ